MQSSAIAGWAGKSVVVPTVNPSGKARNVYYSDSDLVALTVMETIARGSPVVPLWSECASRTLRERIHQRLP